MFKNCSHQAAPNAPILVVAKDIETPKLSVDPQLRLLVCMAELSEGDQLAGLFRNEYDIRAEDPSEGRFRELVPRMFPQVLRRHGVTKGGH
jgi:hypothetical protein